MTSAKETGGVLNSLKVKNRSSVLEMLRHADAPLTIAYITSHTGLSKVTVHKIIDYLVDENLISVVGKGESGEDGGKRPSLFAFNGSYRFIYSVKISESSLIVAIADLKAEILQSKIVAFDRETNLVEILRLIQKSFHELTGVLSLDMQGCIGIVVGCHGITDSEKGVIVTSPHFSSWGSNIPIRDKIADMFRGEIPVYVDNWIRYFAYGEMKTHAPDVDTFMLLGTEHEGVNSGLVMNGRLISGHKGLAGEIGHMIIDPSSVEPCVCGGMGCLEVGVSLRRMEQAAWAKRSDWRDSRLFRNAKSARPTYRRIFDAANEGDNLACSLVEQAVRYFAVAISNITQVCEPGLIIIQGCYAEAGRYFLEQLRARVEDVSLLRMNKGIRVEYTEHGDAWGVTGAAHYVADAFFINLDNIIS